MENNTFKISLPKNPLITLEVITGHFATNYSHTNYYLNVSNLKASSFLARDVAKELAVPYLTSALVNTIVCMDKTEVIGAYLAEELLHHGTAVMNSSEDIHIITPINNVNGKLIFQDNLKKMILNQNIILLVDSVSSRRTINSALECLNYFGGILVGISALFSKLPKNDNYDINAVFTEDDIPDYKFYSPDECVLCKRGHKLDAIINKEGYTKIKNI